MLDTRPPFRKLSFSRFLPENALPARLAASVHTEAISCPDCKPRKTADSKRIAPGRATGNVGGHTFPSANGAPFARITVQAARPGNSFRTTMLVRARTAGEKTGSQGSAIAIK